VVVGEGQQSDIEGDEARVFAIPIKGIALPSLGRGIEHGTQDDPDPIGFGSGIGAMGYDYYKTVPPDAIILLDDDDWLPWVKANFC
jgi:hypothetical protein